MNLNDRQSESRKRILVTGPNRAYGGVELVTSRFMKALSDRFVFDTLSFWDLLQSEYYECGNNVIVLPKRGSNPLAYTRAVRSFFKERGARYDAIWTNLNSFGNIDYLALGKEAGVPVRICHYHSTAVLGSRLDRVLSAFNRRKACSVSTCNIACSEEAGDFAFGGRRYRVIRNAFDLDRFKFSAAAREKKRAELHCGDSFVIGTTGRLSESKNLKHLVDLLPSIKTIRPAAKLVIVGSGECEEALRVQARGLGVSNDVYFAGAQADVTPYLNAFDVFAFPSMFEGLGISVVEAQANGLPCVVSTGVPESARASRSISFVPLDNQLEWIELLANGRRDDYVPDDSALEAFDIALEAEALASILSGDRS